MNFVFRIFAFMIVTCPLVCAQKTDSIAWLDTVLVTSTRLALPELKTPYALSINDKFYLQTGQRQLSINEALQNVPGLIALNPDNFAQDLRVSIRGFGARAWTNGTWMNRDDRWQPGTYFIRLIETNISSLLTQTGWGA